MGKSSGGIRNTAAKSNTDYKADARAEKRADNFKESVRAYLYDEEQYNELAYPGVQSKKVDDLQKKMSDNVSSLAKIYGMSENEVIGNINEYSDPTRRKAWFIRLKNKLRGK